MSVPETSLPIAIVRGKRVVRSITGSSSADVLTNGALFLVGRFITEVGGFDQLVKRHPNAPVIGSADHLVIPGLVNSHVHVGITPFQLGAPDRPLELWAIEKLGRLAVEPYYDQLYGGIRLLESGVTSVQVLHYSPRGSPWITPQAAEGVIDALKTVGLRVVYAPVFTDQNSFVVGEDGGEETFLGRLPEPLRAQLALAIDRQYATIEDVVDLVDDLIRLHPRADDDRVTIMLAPSTAERCSEGLLLATRELANRHRLRIQIHVQETANQLRFDMRTWGTSAVGYLNRLGFLRQDVTCGHSVWLTEEDVDTISARGCSVVHLPSSNLRLSSGVAPVRQLLARGVPIGLGTDEAGVNDDPDLFQEMRLALFLQRVQATTGREPTAHDVFRMATSDGAESIQLGGVVGTLDPGMRADVVLLDSSRIEEPYLDPDVSVVEAIVHRAKPRDVDIVLVDGEVVLQRGKLTRIDRAAAIEEVRKAARSSVADALLRSVAVRVAPYLESFVKPSFPSTPASAPSPNGGPADSSGRQVD